MAIKKPSTVLLGLTFCKSLLWPNFFPPKKARESIRTLIKTMIKRAALLVISIPKYKSAGPSWLIKKYNEAKKPKWMIMAEINHVEFLCRRGLLTGKLIIRKNNPT